MVGDLISAFIIGAGSALGGGLMQSSGDMPKTGTWLFAALAGAVTAAKDFRSLKKIPPVPNGGGTTSFMRKPPDIPPKV